MSSQALRAEKAHTVEYRPGPWFLEGNWKPDGDRIGGWVSSHPAAGGVPIFELLPTVGTKEEICANARLIAAAPELAGCIYDLLYLHEAHHNHPLHAAARALLARATGEAK